MNPETLRGLFARSTAKRGEWNLGMLEIALDLHADAWEKDRAENRELEKARDELGEKLAGLLTGRYLLANKNIVDDLVSKQVRIEELEAERAFAQEIGDGWMECNRLKARIEELERAAKRALAWLEHSRGCAYRMDLDAHNAPCQECDCGLTALRRLVEGATE